MATDRGLNSGSFFGTLQLITSYYVDDPTKINFSSCAENFLLLICYVLHKKKLYFTVGHETIYLLFFLKTLKGYTVYQHLL